MKTTFSQADLASDNSTTIGGASRSALFKWCLCVAICWIAACVPPNGSWQSQPGWQRQQRPAAAYDDEDDVHDGASASKNAGGGGGGGGDSWTCKAVATFVGEGPIETMGQGNTRDDAYYNAFSDCNSLMTTTMTLNQAAGRGTQVVSDCTVTECNQWH